jgi:Spy/CpxP family protein refolding chaperone
MNMKMLWTLGLTVVLLALPAMAQEEDVIIERAGTPAMAPLPPPPPMPPMPPVGGPMMMALPPPAYGIPPHVVEKLGLSKDLVQRVQDLTFEANDQLITLEADLKRAQLALDKLLRAPNPSENAVMQQLEVVGRAEMAMRKNRVGLMLQIKRLLGPDTWQKIEAEMGEFRREIRFLRRGAPEEAPRRPEAPSRPEPRK